MTLTAKSRTFRSNGDVSMPNSLRRFVQKILNLRNGPRRHGGTQSVYGDNPNHPGPSCISEQNE